MLFLGGIEDAKITCPSQLQMNWNYTYDAGSGNVCDDAYLDVCTNTGVLDFDYTKCTQTQAYSSKSIIKFSLIFEHHYYHQQYEIDNKI